MPEVEDSVQSLFFVMSSLLLQASRPTGRHVLVGRKLIRHDIWERDQGSDVDIGLQAHGERGCASFSCSRPARGGGAQSVRPLCFRGRFGGGPRLPTKATIAKMVGVFPLPSDRQNAFPADAEDRATEVGALSRGCRNDSVANRLKKGNNL